MNFISVAFLAILKLHWNSWLTFSHTIPTPAKIYGNFSSALYYFSLFFNAIRDHCGAEL